MTLNMNSRVGYTPGGLVPITDRVNLCRRELGLMFVGDHLSLDPVWLSRPSLMANRRG